MITAIIFDMDGVLVDNEKLKGLSVGMAVQRLRGLAEPDPQGIQAYREMVGASREVVSRHIVVWCPTCYPLWPSTAPLNPGRRWAQ